VKRMVDPLLKSLVKLRLLLPNLQGLRLGLDLQGLIRPNMWGRWLVSGNLYGR
jgi:hypothetical protein